MTMPMAATEGSVTPWYLITLAMGGQLFDDNYAPLFADPDSAGVQGAAMAGRRAQQRLGLTRFGDPRRWPVA